MALTLTWFRWLKRLRTDALAPSVPGLPHVSWSSRRGIQLLIAMFRVRVSRLLERLCYGRIKNRSKELNADFLFS